MSQVTAPILALDTSAGASVCLILSDGTSTVASLDSPRSHSRELLPMLQKIVEDQSLTWQELAGFAVGVGPGSFTGLRVACATIAGINASLKKPVYALSSLAITARQAKVNTTFWAIEDARSGLVYAAKFENQMNIVAPQCLTWEDFLAEKPETYVTLGNAPKEVEGLQKLPLQLSRESALQEIVQELDETTPARLWVEPLYLQLSQAEKNLL